MPTGPVGAAGYVGLHGLRGAGCPSSKRAPQARGQGMMMPSSNHLDAFNGVQASYRKVLWGSSVDVRKWCKSSIFLM